MILTWVFFGPFVTDIREFHFQSFPVRMAVIIPPAGDDDHDDFLPVPITIDIFIIIIIIITITITSTIIIIKLLHPKRSSFHEDIP